MLVTYQVLFSFRPTRVSEAVLPPPTCSMLLIPPVPVAVSLCRLMVTALV